MPLFLPNFQQNLFYFIIHLYPQLFKFTPSSLEQCLITQKMHFLPKESQLSNYEPILPTIVVIISYFPLPYFYSHFIKLTQYNKPLSLSY